MFSILLPSLRENLLKQRIIDWANTNPDEEYELVVVSPFKVQDPSVLWIKEKEKSNSVIATNVAHSYANGDYLVYFSDDVIPGKDCLKNMRKFIESQEKKPFLGAFKMISQNGKEIGPFGSYDKLYACYGCISTKDIKLVDEIIFSPEFQYSWADIDLSLRIWEVGGEVKVCQDAIVIPNQIEDDIYKAHRNTFQTDFNNFTYLWHDKLGKGMERQEGLINRRLNERT